MAKLISNAFSSFIKTLYQYSRLLYYRLSVLSIQVSRSVVFTSQVSRIVVLLSSKDSRIVVLSNPVSAQLNSCIVQSGQPQSDRIVIVQCPVKSAAQLYCPFKPAAQLQVQSTHPNSCSYGSHHQRPEACYSINQQNNVSHNLKIINFNNFRFFILVLYSIKFSYNPVTRVGSVTTHE